MSYKILKNLISNYIKYSKKILDQKKLIGKANKKSHPKMATVRSLWWSKAGLNRRHMDFQSIALPTELPDHIKN